MEYAVTRGEVMAWYLRSWTRPSRLWGYRAWMLAMLGCIAWLAAKPGWRLLTGAGLWAAYFAFVFAWPMLNYKPQYRWLVISPEGFETGIGTRRKRAAWREVRSVDLEQATVVITLKSNNAMLVPRRAFADETAMHAFCATARSWLGTA